MTLRTLRLRRKLTQERLEDLSGVDQTVISLLERGKLRRPTFQAVERLAVALGVSLREMAEIIHATLRTPMR